VGVKRGLLIAVILAILLVGFLPVQAENGMVVEANFIDFGEETITVEVPDYISLGEVSKDDPVSSLEPKIRINNTGNMKVLITPELATGSSPAFNYLFFRKQKTTSTNDTSLTAFHQIGTYNVNIDRGDYETFYISLNLTDFDGVLSSDNLNLSTTVKFTAMAS
jgi:hypothetical protein